MDLRYLMPTVALAALAACDGPSAHGAASGISEPAASEAAAAVRADAAWGGLIGLWAPEGACGDDARALHLEENAFQLRAARCSIVRLEMIEDGVRAITQCTLGGKDDRIVDNFKFIEKGPDGLTMINEANDGVKNAFVRCRGRAQ